MSKQKTTLKAMVAYEKLTGKNAFELIRKENKTATEYRDYIFLVLSSLNADTTLEQVENLSDEQLKEVFKQDEAAGTQAG